MLQINRQDPLIKKWLSHIDECVGAVESIPPPTYHELMLFQREGDRVTFEKKYFARRQRLTAYGLLHALYPEKESYLRILENVIWEVLQEFTWCLPAHIDEAREFRKEEKEQPQYTIDLFAAETAFTLAEMIAMFDDLDDFLIMQIKQQINLRVLNNFMENGPYHWEKATHNWASVCAGSIGCAALYIMEEGPKRDHVLVRVFDAIDCYLSGIEEDGACTEGYSYWKYGFGYFVYFLALYEKKLGIPTTYWTNPKVKMLATFQQKIYLAEDHIVNFSDAQAKANPMLGFSHFLHKKIPEVHLPAIRLAETEIIDHCGRWAPAIRELLWYDSNKRGEDWPDGSWFLKDSQIAISRFHINGKTFAFAAKGGHNDEPHNHLDIGQFILYANGETYCRDLGAGVYSKDYFNENRYTYLCNGAHGHSIPVINDAEQEIGRQFHASITSQHHTDTEDLLAMDMTNAYPTCQLNQYIRTYRWKKGEQPRLYLKDSFQFKKDYNRIVERFVLSDLPYQRIENGLIMKEMHIYWPSFVDRVHMRRSVFTNHFGRKEFVNMLEIEIQKASKRCQLEFQFVWEESKDHVTEVEG